MGSRTILSLSALLPPPSATDEHAPRVVVLGGLVGGANEQSRWGGAMNLLDLNEENHLVLPRTRPATFRNVVMGGRLA
jgi:hypothetical protein